MTKNIDPTETEVAILKILWQQGSGTVREVNDQLNQQKVTGYTTTLKLMQIMHAKGLLHRDETNRQHVYTAAVAENNIKQRFLQKLMKNLYQGSASAMVMQIIGNTKTTKAELEEIKEYIKKMEEDTNDQ
jgi:BlaI family transcriptional regulator, penicillinase repressor